MHADPILQAYADAEHIEAASRVASITRVDARAAAMFEEPAGFSVMIGFCFTASPMHLRADTVRNVRYLRHRLRALERALRRAEA
jgi:hypothetical protein